MPKRTMTRRFYKTASAINNPQILGTLEEATRSAKTYIWNTNVDEVYVVEVVRVVRRQETPIIVEEVRR